MEKDNQDEILSQAINQITEKVSRVLLKEFLKLPSDHQINLILIKSAQLLLANVLCQVATTKEELEKIATEQGIELKELTLVCAYTGFADKFDGPKH